MYLSIDFFECRLVGVVVVELFFAHGHMMNRPFDVEDQRMTVSKLFEEKFIECAPDEFGQEEQLFASMLDIVVGRIRQGNVDQAKGEIDCCRRSIDQCDSQV